MECGDYILDVVRLSPGESYQRQHKAAVLWKGSLLFKVTHEVWKQCLLTNGSITIGKLSSILAGDSQAFVRLIMERGMKKPQKESSIIQNIDYAPETCVLTVTFTTGAIYSYQDVPSRTVGNFRKAPSQGAFFHKHIRNVYDTTLVQKAESKP